jgi:transposase
MRLLNDFDPMTPVEQIRYDLAHELLDDVERLDAQLKVSHRRIKEAVQASGTSLTDLYGVGPILACALTGYTGDVRRFGNRDQFASYAGVAPIGGAMSDEHCPGCGRHPWWPVRCMPTYRPLQDAGASSVR